MSQAAFWEMDYFDSIAGWEQVARRAALEPTGYSAAEPTVYSDAEPAGQEPVGARAGAKAVSPDG